MVLKIETLTYGSTHYTWHHEPQNLYQARHITIYDAVQVITRNDSVVSSQCVGGEERYKPESGGKPILGK